MMVLSIKTQSNPKDENAICTIELSDGSVFFIKPCYLSSQFRDDISEILNKEISFEEEEDIRFAAYCFQAEEAALRLIARAEQTSLGLSLKLQQRSHNKSCVKKVIDRLLEKEILSDSRYARAWLESRLIKRGETPRSLLAGLYNKGIDRKNAVSILKSLLPFEEELNLLEKYIEKNKLSVKDEKSSMKSKLQYEGFSADAIQEVLEGDL